MNDRQVECFLRAATLLNFHRAAEELFISQPTITYQIRSLENELGFALFERSGRSIALTKAGDSLYKSLIAIKASLDRAITEAKEVAEAPEGFSLTWPPAICDRETITALVEGFATAYPSIPLNIRVAEGEHPASIQEEQGVVLTLDKDAGRYSGFSSLPLFQTTIACMVSASHPLAQRESVSWDLLQNQKVLLVPPDLCPNSYAALLQKLNMHLPLRNISYLESETSIDINIAAGRGVGFRPVRNELLHQPQNGIVPVPLAPADISELCVIYPTSEKDGPMGKFANYAHDYFRKIKSD